MLVVKEIRFEAAHRLPNYQGKCEHLHGHSWRFQLTVEAAVNPADGMAIDFLEIQQVVKDRCLETLDHSYLNDYIEHPSAENVALWIWEKVADDLPIKEVKVWETDDAFVVYAGPAAELHASPWHSLVSLHTNYNLP